MQYIKIKEKVQLKVQEVQVILQERKRKFIKIPEVQVYKMQVLTMLGEPLERRRRVVVLHPST